MMSVSDSPGKGQEASQKNSAFILELEVRDQTKQSEAKEPKEQSRRQEKG